MTFLVGSYAAAPPDTAAPAFGELLRALARRPLVGGLEIPDHHLQDTRAAAAIAAEAPAEWRFSITCIPGTMRAMQADPAEGLASVDGAGRRAAVEFAAQVREQVLRFDAAVGGGRVDTVLLHSAPVGGERDALAASLSEIAAWDWAGAALALEHCDAAVDDHPAQKGFLALEDELDVLGRLEGVGLVVNWGRSAIETRSVDGPVDHLTRARAAGLLSGLMFSGVAATDSPFGPAWIDAHLPSSTVTRESLLTPAEIRRSILAAGDGVRLGLKIGVRPSDAPTAHLVGVIDQVLGDLESAAQDPFH